MRRGRETLWSRAPGPPAPQPPTLLFTCLPGRGVTKQALQPDYLGSTPSCPPATCVPPRESLNLLGSSLVGTEGTELSLSTSLSFSVTIDDTGMMTDST